jgi:hypothetical protein
MRKRWLERGKEKIEEKRGSLAASSARTGARSREQREELVFSLL